MPKLILKRKAEVLAEFPLRSGNATYSIGSDQGNDLVINDKMVSMTHFYVERQGNQYFVRDLKSAFGTLVNGDKISSKVEVRDGDIIQIGEHTLIFKNPLENQKPDAKAKPRQAIEEFWGDIKDTVLNSQVSENGAAAEEEEELVDETEPVSRSKGAAVKAPPKAGSRADQIKTPDLGVLEKSPYYLLAVHGPYLGKKYQLNFGETKVGRDVKLNDIVIRQNKKGEVDPSVSRRHATISFRDGGFYVTDKRSQSRTFVNDHCLSETEEMQLVPGDEIEIVSDQQSTIFRFVAEGNWDFSSPGKAGEWYIRHRRLAMDLGTLALLVLGAVFGYQALGDWLMTTQKPQPFKVAHEKFQSGDLSTPDGNSAPAGAKAGIGEPIARDFNGDRYVDYAYAYSDGVLIAVDGKTRRRLWQASGIVVDATKPLTVVDLNNNGLDDLVVVTSDGRLSGIDGLFGAEIWTSPIFENSLVSSAAVGDLDRDGLKDAAVITLNDKLEVGYSRVNNLDWVEIDLGISSRVAPSVADLNGDGSEEVLIVTESGLILIYNGMERRISETIDINETLNKARGSFAQVYEVRHPVATADMSGDGTLDLAMVTARGEVLAIDGATHRALWWAEAGAGGPAAPGDAPASLVLGDLDKDDLPDVLVTYGNGMYAFRAARRDAQQEQAFWEKIDDGAATTSTQIVAVDFDRDGAAEAIRVREGRVEMISGRAGEMLWENGNAPAVFAEHMTPLIADFVKNGYLDVMVLDREGDAHLFSTNRRVKTATVMWGQRHATAGNASMALPEATNSGKHLTVLALSLAIPLGAVVGNLLARRRRKGFSAN